MTAVVELLDRFTVVIAERFTQLEARVAALEVPRNEWYDTQGAAAYLGVTANALRKVADRREIEFEQESRGCKMWFRRSTLDAYRRGERQR